ncbi:uncharacterized protein MELLADRAFT_107281 [Melampsora larici-populina 98AG31]|uniref:Uncharacterized protein n=1 Tax=Melampsora larici-populina (strain 98AG31 / pathotype 3-4-7) TaxID=747676 RepID=F4RNT6_MELLP|nr:uncharacterized protein MELLADRAFT_107281 [Melampsora larici-populina 98AG31]EGG05801.1 hypothetical protein MELLADRAFT_107281 [Melampsora larici-populina 98AG31]
MASASSPTWQGDPTEDPQNPPSMLRGALPVTPTPPPNASHHTVDDDAWAARLLSLKAADVLHTYDQVVNHFDMTDIVQQRIRVIFEQPSSEIRHMAVLQCLTEFGLQQRKRNLVDSGLAHIPLCPRKVYRASNHFILLQIQLWRLAKNDEFIHFQKVLKWARTRRIALMSKSKKGLGTKPFLENGRSADPPNSPIGTTTSSSEAISPREMPSVPHLVECGTGLQGIADTDTMFPLINYSQGECPGQTIKGDS